MEVLGASEFDILGTRNLYKLFTWNGWAKIPENALLATFLSKSGKGLTLDTLVSIIHTKVYEIHTGAPPRMFPMISAIQFQTSQLDPRVRFGLRGKPSDHTNAKTNNDVFTKIFTRPVGPDLSPEALSGGLKPARASASKSRRTWEV